MNVYLPEDFVYESHDKSGPVEWGRIRTLTAEPESMLRFAAYVLSEAIRAAAQPKGKS